MSISASEDLSNGGGAALEESPESGFSHLLNKELYPIRERVVGKCPVCHCELRVNVQLHLKCHQLAPCLPGFMYPLSCDLTHLLFSNLQFLHSMEVQCIHSFV